MTVKVAVIYYSATGTVHALAQAVAAAPITQASVEDLVWADAFAFGTPARFGAPAAQLKQFIDQTSGLWREGSLADKPVTAFTSAFNRHGGSEAAILSLANVFYHWGALIVPPGYTDPVVYAAGANPYGTSFASGTATGSGPDSAALDAEEPVTGDYELSALEWVREHVGQIVRTGTTDGVTMKGFPTMLMTYRGAKTGKVRKTPVMRVEHGGRYAAVASKGAGRWTRSGTMPATNARPAARSRSSCLNRSAAAPSLTGRGSSAPQV